MDRTSKVMIVVGIPVMVIGLVFMFDLLKIPELTWAGVALTLIGAALAWIGYARAKGLVT